MPLSRKGGTKPDHYIHENLVSFIHHCNLRRKQRIEYRTTMESHLAPPHGDVYEEDPKPIGLHSVVEGDQEENGGHHEKKSVLKKVKAKARKLRDTITRHGHSHDEHIPDDHDLDEEEDDEDEEMVEDPEVHGAPIYDSAAAGFAHSIPVKAPGDREQLFDPRSDGNLSGSKVETMENLRDDYHGGDRTPMNTPLSTSAAPPTTQLPDEPARVFVHGREGAPKVNLTRPHGSLEEDPQGPTSRSRPPPNYETKVTGPTHTDGNEAKIDPLSSSFGEMKIGDKGEAKTSQLTGSHDQFSPETPSKVGGGGSEGSSYTGKISSAVADTAVAAKNLVASKLGYGTTTEAERPQQQGGGYTEKIWSAGHVIADTAASAKSFVASNLGYGGSKEEPTCKEASGVGGFSGVSDPPVVQDKSVSVKDYWVEKLKPGEEDKALSEVISNAFHPGKKAVVPETEEAVVPETEEAVVTETEEVRRFLGEGDDHQLSSPGKKVVETLRGSVGSWFGKPVEPEKTADHHGAGAGEEHHE